MKPTILVVAGPGHHATMQSAALGQRWVVHQTTARPAFTVRRFAPGEASRLIEGPLAWHGLLARASWAAWRRMPVIGNQESPRALFSVLQDRLSLRHLDANVGLVIGWSQASLRVMRRARKRGVPTILEHPTIHINEWQRRTERAYREIGIRNGYATLPRSLVSRMLAEYEEATEIHVLSSFARQTFIEGGIEKDRVRIVLPGVDVSKFSPGVPRERTSRLQVLYVGRLEAPKGIRVLLQAMSRLEAVADLVVVGTVLPECRHLIAQAPMTVRVLGPKPADELAVIYREADVLVMPSTYDAFGLVILGAMASGIAVIATTSTGAPDVIRNEVDGFLVPPWDADALTERVAWCAANPERRLAIGRSARARVLDSFTEEHYAARLLATVSEAVD